MGWFGKSKHERQADGLVRVFGNIYTMTTEGRHGAPPVLVFRRDARYRHLMFCLCTAHVACARVMANPDAVLNDVLHRAVTLASVDGSKPAISSTGKTGHFCRAETGEFYCAAASARKSVWTLVRQLRGPHLRTWAWCSSRSRSAVTAAVSPSSLPQSSTGRFDVRSVEARS